MDGRGVCSQAIANAVYESVGGFRHAWIWSRDTYEEKRRSLAVVARDALRGRYRRPRAFESDYISQICASLYSATLSSALIISCRVFYHKSEVPIICGHSAKRKQDSIEKVFLTYLFKRRSLLKSRKSAETPRSVRRHSTTSKLARTR